jgi:hypothetical protein
MVHAGEEIDSLNLETKLVSKEEERHQKTGWESWTAGTMEECHVTRSLHTPHDDAGPEQLKV